ncbi:MAG: hypothetical protein CR971_01200 [candidate division SR1 bacterium]|nr:MAG: hypothetical protein CR971_01200 [candidate division SR1 bacterium]
MLIPIIFIALLIGIIFSPIKRSKKILFCGIILTLFGILAVYSVSTYESFHHTLKHGIDNASNYFYFKGQIKNIIISLIIGILVYKLPLHFFTNQRYNNWFMGIALIIQWITLIIGKTFNGATGWIHLGFTTVQPSEFFKIAYVLFIASRLVRKKTLMNDHKFVWLFIIIHIGILLVFTAIPDFGTILILGMISIVMVWYAGLSEKKVGIILGAAGISFMILLGVLSLVSKSESFGGTKFAYLQNRLIGFFHNGSDEYSKTVNRQLEQSKLAIGGGGFRGQGYGKGLQKFGYIPIAQSDFIFAAYSEEIGFIGNMSLLAMYFFLMFYFMSKIRNTKDELTRFIGIGLISTIIIQMFINIGVNLGIVPNTGITLPFVSHGGTAFMANTIQLMLLYKITHQNEHHTLGYQTR